MSPELQGELVKYMVMIGGPMGVLTVLMFYMSRKDNMRYAEDLKQLYERHVGDLKELVRRWDDRSDAFEQIVRDNTASAVALREEIRNQSDRRKHVGTT